MPKMKTVRGAKKRFRRNGSGKYFHYPANHRHLLGKKERRRKRRLKGKRPVFASEVKWVKRLVPYL